ncbi:MAG: cbb3-type cytochrome oxidase assembly protein CcoS [Campylobacteraceae bacterium]|nr:cbb3-type cytochrome oxidase assembly protein CcoS [Campylobacteraceae bacterium]
MSGSIVAMMIGVSMFLGACALVALLWGLKTGQFEDQNKFINGAQFDGEDELRDAVMMERRRKRAQEKREKSGYKPPD